MSRKSVHLGENATRPQLENIVQNDVHRAIVQDLLMVNRPRGITDLSGINLLVCELQQRRRRSHPAAVMTWYGLHPTI